MKIPSEDSILELERPERLESLQLEPEEAFVLSRVDGSVTLKQISQMLSYDIDRVWRLLSRGVEAGVVRIKGESTVAPARAAKAPEDWSILHTLDEEDRDPVLSKIPRAKRNEILLRYNAMAAQNHYDLLGVNPGAGAEEIRTQYFQFVKVFHPDRFFGKEMGPYRQKLDELFKKVTAAFEELQDPGRRGRYDRALGNDGPKEGPKAKEPKGARLKGRTLVERLALGKRYFEMGLQEEAGGNGLKAANFYQMALQFEPSNKEYQSALERNGAFILRKRADDAVQRARALVETNNYNEAAELLAEALKIDPKKRECYRELVLIYLKYKGKLPQAKELVEYAVRMFKNDADMHALLGQVLLQMGKDSDAKATFKEALRLDGKNAEAQEGLDQIKRK